eukprot:COSAG02_NODE_37795_length_437_cov_1.053254_1_plen_44_part_10
MHSTLNPLLNVGCLWNGVPLQVWPQGGGGFSNVFARPTWQHDAV